MRRDLLYLQDILDAADAVTEFVGDATADALAGNDMLRSAVLHKITVTGEAANRLSAGLRERYPNVPWSDIIALRNIAVH